MWQIYCLIPLVTSTLRISSSLDSKFGFNFDQAEKCASVGTLTRFAHGCTGSRDEHVACACSSGCIVQLAELAERSALVASDTFGALFPQLWRFDGRVVCRGEDILVSDVFGIV